MSAYEELIAECQRVSDEGYETGAFDELGPDASVRAILAVVFRTLEKVTPTSLVYLDTAGEMNETWLAMLRASPLAPGYAK